MTFQKYLIRHTNRQKIIITVMSLLISCFILLRRNTATPIIACHYIEASNALPSAEESSFFPQCNSMFFHETSCRGDLNSRQACAVESAARAHPHWQIHVLFSAPVNNLTLNGGSLKQLQMYKNIHFSRVFITEYVKGSPFESLVADGALNRSHWPIQHTSDILRLITLQKWGGVYLDLDVVVARSLENLGKNWGVRESVKIVNGILSLSRDAVGSMISDALIRTLASNFTGDTWGNNGPALVTRVLQNLCSTTNPSLMSEDTCRGFQVYSPELFLPILWEQSKAYFSPGNLSVHNPYTYHIWNQLTQGIKTEKDSLYAKIAKAYCPVIYEMFGDSFGV